MAENTSKLNMCAVSKALSVILTLLFSLLILKIEENGPQSGSDAVMFLIIISLVAHSGMSLTLYIYTSAIDAIILAFFLQPESVRKQNQIVYLRFLRTTETALR